MSSSVSEEEVELSVICDDGVRLWVDHRLLIDEWHTESDSRNSSSLMNMKPFELYHLVLEYREVALDAYISLLWKLNNMSNAEIIPQSALYHIYEVSDSLLLEPTIRGGYKGRGNWNRRDSETSSLKRGTQVKVVSAETSHEITDCIGNGLFGGVAGQEHTFLVK